MMSSTRDLVRHHAWATAELLAACRALEPAMLEATVPGTYGSVIATLRHLVSAEGGYVFRLTRAWPERPWQGDVEVSLDVLAERAAILAETLERFLETGWDPDREGEARGDQGEVFAVTAGVFLTQLFHHANEHRAHVCTILGAHGIEPPDVSAWGYAQATGRSRLVSGPTAASG